MGEVARTRGAANVKLYSVGGMLPGGLLSVAMGGFQQVLRMEVGLIEAMAGWFLS